MVCVFVAVTMVSLEFLPLSNQMQKQYQYQCQYWDWYWYWDLYCRRYVCLSPHEFTRTRIHHQVGRHLSLNSSVFDLFGLLCKRFITNTYQTWTSRLISTTQIPGYFFAASRPMQRALSSLHLHRSPIYLAAHVNSLSSPYRELNESCCCCCCCLLAIILIPICYPLSAIRAQRLLLIETKQNPTQNKLNAILANITQATRLCVSLYQSRSIDIRLLTSIRADNHCCNYESDILSVLVPPPVYGESLLNTGCYLDGKNSLDLLEASSDFVQLVRIVGVGSILHLFLASYFKSNSLLN